MQDRRFDDVVHNAERFRIGWERGGRQAADGLAKAGVLGGDGPRHAR